MAITKIASVYGATPTGSINTTGADFIVAGLTTAGGSFSAAMTDSKSNSYTEIGEQVDNVPPVTEAMYYKAAPTVGSGHTFSGSAFYEGVMAIAFSGLDASPFDQSNGGISNADVTSFQPGSITPTVNGCLIVTHIGFSAAVDMASVTAPSGFTLELDGTPSTAGMTEGAMAWMIQTTAAAINPTWGMGTSNRCAASVASFKPVAGSAITAAAGASTVSFAGSSVGAGTMTAADGASTVSFTSPGTIAGTMTAAAGSSTVSFASPSNGTLTLDNFVNWSNSPYASVTVDYVKVFALDDGALVLELTNHAIDSGGDMTITGSGIVPTDDYMVFGFKNDGSISFRKAVTAT